MISFKSWLAKECDLDEATFKEALAQRFRKDDGIPPKAKMLRLSQIDSIRDYGEVFKIFSLQVKG